MTEDEMRRLKLAMDYHRRRLGLSYTSSDSDLDQYGAEAARERQWTANDAGDGI